MDRDMIEKQIAHLHGLKDREQARLERARRDCQEASGNLQRIDGGLEIAQWFLGQLRAPDGQDVQLEVGSNGELRAEPVQPTM